jgi:hypothetical protein
VSQVVVGAEHVGQGVAQAFKAASALSILIRSSFILAFPCLIKWVLSYHRVCLNLNLA